MLTVRQANTSYPGAASLEQTHGWVLIRTDGPFDGAIGIMTPPYATPEIALGVLHLFAAHLATVAYAAIDRS